MMKKHAYWIFGCVLTGVLALSVASAQDLTDVDEIVRRANETAYYQGQDGRARVTMTITDARGQRRVKEMTILRKNMDDKNEEQVFYVYFHRPADEQGTTFLVHKHVGRDDDRWLFLPALNLVRRIAASDERTSFVGSHFFYEDISGRGLEEDHHELIETNQTYYVVKNTPVKPETVEFDSYTVFIHKGTFLPVEIRFEKNGEVYRSAKTLNVEHIASAKDPDKKYVTVTQGSMKDDTIGGETILEYSKVEYDLDLPDDIFTERRLRTPPQEFLQ